MINSYLTRLYLNLITFFQNVVDHTRTRHVAQARGVNFIEYALLAVIAIVIGIAFRGALENAFTAILNRIQEGVKPPSNN